MGPAFFRWLDSFNAFQRRRGSGAVSDSWGDLRELQSRVDDLASEGLDSRAAAACLVELEQASLLFEERRYDECLSTAIAACPSIPVYGAAAELINSNRELVIGNVYLVRDEDGETAAEFFRRSIAASGPATPLIRANAAFNLGICQNILDLNSEALESFKMAAQSYALAGRDDKIGDVLHSIGNTYRNMDEPEIGIPYLLKALESYGDPVNYMGAWRVADDISRVYLTLAAELPEEREELLEQASKMSDFALYASTEVWRTLRREERRLTDLSDQMLHLATTRCEIAMLEDKPDDLLATLAVMKGRIRLTRSTIPPSVLEEKDEEFKEAIVAGVPHAHLELVLDALKHLSNGHTVALVDHFAIYGNQLAIAYVVPSQKTFGGYCACLEDDATEAVSAGLRGRQRGVKIADACQTLLNSIVKHDKRCSMVLPEEPEETDEAARNQLREWSEELIDALTKLGQLFFPDDLLDDFRNSA